MKTTTTITMMMIPFTLLALLFATATAFSGNTGRNAAAATSSTSSSRQALGGTPSCNNILVSRTTFVTGVTGAILTGAPAMAFAKKEQNTPKTLQSQKPLESKQNKKTCLDLCLYECVKNGGTQEECATRCESKCNTTKGQRTVATPVDNKK